LRPSSKDLSFCFQKLIFKGQSYLFAAWLKLPQRKTATEDDGEKDRERSHVENKK